MNYFWRIRAIKRIQKMCSIVFSIVIVIEIKSKAKRSLFWYVFSCLIFLNWYLLSWIFLREFFFFFFTLSYLFLECQLCSCICFFEDLKWKDGKSTRKWGFFFSHDFYSIRTSQRGSLMKHCIQSFSLISISVSRSCWLRLFSRSSLLLITDTLVIISGENEGRSWRKSKTLLFDLFHSSSLSDSYLRMWLMLYIDIWT